MKITKFKHACLLVEDGDARVLIDPGAYSVGWDELEGLTGVLITHQHPDHVAPDRLKPLLERNQSASLHTDEGTVKFLAEQGIDAHAVHAGDTVEGLGTSVEVFGVEHAVIHPDIPTIPNTGFLLGGRLFHPGDSFTVPDRPVEILGLPTGGPWLKAGEAVDYLRAVAPRVAVPIHEAVLSSPAMVYGMFSSLKPDGTDVRIIDEEPIEL